MDFFPGIETPKLHCCQQKSLDKWDGVVRLLSWGFYRTMSQYSRLLPTLHVTACTTGSEDVKDNKHGNLNV